MGDIISNTINHFKKGQKGFSIYRLPNSKKIHLLAGTVDKFQSQNSGFILSSFEKSGPTLFINSEEKEEHNELSILLKKYENLHPIEEKVEPKETSSSTFEDYETGFNFIKTQIQKDNIQKAILSRKIDVCLDVDFNYTTFFEKLLKNFNTAYCFLIYIPGFGIWVGASPETLLKNIGNNYSTISLAGTKNGKETPWTDKEIEEQKIVTDNIISTLKTEQVTPKVTPLETIKAGNIFHLKNEISFEEKNENFFELAKALHPTPAIGGFPKNKSEQIIQEAERHSREFYCGYAGPVTKQEKELFVLIRCGKISNGILSIFAGGGITNKSELKKEWDECERKAQSITQYL